jgi:hypothetical protein
MCACVCERRCWAHVCVRGECIACACAVLKKMETTTTVTAACSFSIEQHYHHFSRTHLGVVEYERPARRVRRSEDNYYSFCITTTRACFIANDTLHQTHTSVSLSMSALRAASTVLKTRVAVPLTRPVSGALCRDTDSTCSHVWSSSQEINFYEER